jgi:hypothetical protein
LDERLLLLRPPSIFDQTAEDKDFKKTMLGDMLLYEVELDPSYKHIIAYVAAAVAVLLYTEVHQ